ncbi:MAG: hypothetical protein P4M05_27380, partial [Bradyrhizobium sp.]|nr:hypothetical protein [Bradyrhizobium sp.]
GSQRWFLPLWFDANFTTEDAAIGSTRLGCPTAVTSAMRSGQPAYLVGVDVFDFELVQILDVDGAGVILNAPTTKFWPAGSRIHPACIARLTDQPTLAKQSDRVVTSEVRFQAVDAIPDFGDAASSSTRLPDLYRGFAVMPFAPDESQTLTLDYERLLTVLDNQTSIPRQIDQSGRTFPIQQYSWVITGRDEHLQFDALLQLLRGRAVPIWMPTFMQDFVIAADIGSGATAIVVKRSGFAFAGGPRPDRQDIMIETDGETYYRRITDVASSSGGTETLVLDAAIPVAVAQRKVHRICFMLLMRLNQDTIQIQHTTDNEGVSTILAPFRSAPDTRVPLSAF